MRVIIASEDSDVFEFSADFIHAQISKKSSSVIGLATGCTPLEIYGRLRNLFVAGELSFSDVSTFNLDEYVGLSPTSPQSYRYYMQVNLFDHVDIDPKKTHLPTCGDPQDASSVSRKYEAAILNSGGIDLQLLGIGANGHVAFNEPTSSLASRTRIKTLTDETVRDNHQFFAGGETQPNLAITMGVATIMEARQLLLVAVGDSKALAVRHMIEGAISARWPATALQNHPDVTVVLDSCAAKLLELKGYYQTTERYRASISS